MRIKSIEIELEHITADGNSKTVLLYRGEDKLWNVVDDGQCRGLFPGEIGLANRIQEEIFGKLNLNDKS